MNNTYAEKWGETNITSEVTRDPDVKHEELALLHSSPSSPFPLVLLPDNFVTVNDFPRLHFWALFHPSLTLSLGRPLPPARAFPFFYL